MSFEEIKEKASAQLEKSDSLIKFRLIVKTNLRIQPRGKMILAHWEVFIFDIITPLFDTDIANFLQSGLVPDRSTGIPIGLRDGYTTEIYENDIVEFDDTYIGGENGSGLVTWVGDLTMVSIPGFYIESLEGGIWNRPFPMHCKVLGNKHQNPQLLRSNTNECRS